jgi:hypothetical protein
VEDDDDYYDDWMEQYEENDGLNDALEEIMAKGRTIHVGLIDGVLKDKKLHPGDKGDIIRDISDLMDEKTEGVPELKYFVVGEDGELLI